MKFPAYRKFDVILVQVIILNGERQDKMKVINSIIMAFAMYSKLPMPNLTWKKENMEYILSGFCIVGFIQAIIYILLWRFLIFFNIKELMRNAVMIVFPIIYTGGIHLDGFLDTLDALGSHQTKERKLEILKDSHIGAYAVIGLCIYYILYFSAFFYMKTDIQIYMFSLSFILARAYSASSLIFFKNARSSGLAMTFSENSLKKINAAILVLIIVFTSIFAVKLNFRSGIGLAISSLITFLYYKYMAYKEFGGITGDLAGYFYQLAELAALILIALA